MEVCICPGLETLKLDVGANTNHNFANNWISSPNVCFYMLVGIIVNLQYFLLLKIPIDTVLSWIFGNFYLLAELYPSFFHGNNDICYLNWVILYSSLTQSFRWRKCPDYPLVKLKLFVKFPNKHQIIHYVAIASNLSVVLGSVEHDL